MPIFKCFLDNLVVLQATKLKKARLRRLVFSTMAQDSYIPWLIVQIIHNQYLLTPESFMYYSALSGQWCMNYR